LEGIEICRRLKADAERRHVYVIMLTGNRTTSDIVAALDAGADDFVAKPFDVEELRVRLRAGQRVVDLQRELHHKASHDDLTGMLNRRMVLDLLVREHARAVRERTPLSVGMLDIDYFKGVNDTHGHQAGDSVLQEVASRIKTSLRQYDIAGRYGGEEFLLVMPHCDARTAFTISERVRSAIAATPIATADAAVAITVSIGTATMKQPADTSHRALMAEADRALYRAKSEGRNRVRGFTPS
jgi:diguanylate cyclase (GGDEF)-like protein